MARKRTKPVADHIDATTQAADQAVTETSAPKEVIGSSASAEPDIFDQVIAARAEGRFEKSEPSTPAVSGTAARVESALAAAPVMRASELTQPAPVGAEREEDITIRTPVMPKFSGKLPNPHSIDQISLEADSRNGAQMRLLRYHYAHRGEAKHDVWIQFDKNPGKEVTEPLKAEGFRWEPEAKAGDRKGAWVKPLEPGREIRIMLDAERLFKDLGNQIRKANGLEPVGQVGVGAG